MNNDLRRLVGERHRKIAENTLEIDLDLRKIKGHFKAGQWKQHLEKLQEVLG